MDSSNKIFFDSKLIGIFIDMDNFKESCFPTPDDQSLQLGLWFIEDEKVYEKHIHKQITRTIENTSEFIYVLKGKITIELYSSSNKFIKNVILESNQAFLQFIGGHKIVADSETKFFEIKQGPYMGRDADKFTVE